FIPLALPLLAKHACILTQLTTKAADIAFPAWSPAHQQAFQAIKDLVVSPACLTSIGHDNPGENCIFVTTDTSEFCTGAL
ncbi:hypothetical protein SERLA73DRAFT_38835, partial [Serpula lacrymans var. lacrymans S7.3]